MDQSPPPITCAEVEAYVREWFEIGNTLDPDRITENYAGGHGFGYRTRASRPPCPSKESYRENLTRWLDTLASYSIHIEELHSCVEGNIGIVWGFYREEFQEKRGNHRTLRGRFSETVAHDENGWRTIFYHRDMTPFDESGAYSPSQGETRE